MTMRSHFVRPGRQFLLCAAVTLALAGTAMAQSTTAAKPAATSDDSGYSKWDVTPFFGWQWFQAFQGNNLRNYANRFDSGWLFGDRINADFSPHFGIEGSLAMGSNKLGLRPYGQNDFAHIGTKNVEVALHLVYNFQPRTAKTRFFILAGPAAVWYIPGSSTGGNAVGNFVQPRFPLEKKLEPALTYGVGMKHYMSPAWGLRFDVGGRLNPAAHFGLPTDPSGPNTVYIPYKGKNSSLYVSVGVILRMGYVYPPPPPNPLISQTLRVDVPAGSSTPMTISGAPATVCPGDDVRLSVNSAGFANPTYQWQVNGAPAAGGTGQTFNVPTAAGSGSRSVTVTASGGSSSATSAPFATSPGHTYHLTAEAAGLNGRNASYQWLENGQPISGATSSSYDLGDTGAQSISVRVSVPNPPVTSAPASFTINQLAPPTLTFAVSPSTVPYSSGPVPLRAVATASTCGAPVNVRYSGEGVTGTNFNPGSVSGFDMGNRLRAQSKTVTLTATATDAKNQTVTRTAPITVTLDPEARRLDDVVFQSMSSRVNNCGKRLLLEELTPILRNDPGAKVVLIGHRDEKEKGSKAALALDRTRVLNAAAVLSAGKGICPQLDLSRIQMKAVGTDQSATPRPALCGASTNVKERSGQAVKETDKNAEYRRVEVWVIPSGAAMPAGLTGLEAVPSAEVTKLGCPK